MSGKQKGKLFDSRVWWQQQKDIVFQELCFRMLVLQAEQRNTWRDGDKLGFGNFLQTSKRKEKSLQWLLNFAVVHLGYKQEENPSCSYSMKVWEGWLKIHNWNFWSVFLSIMRTVCGTWLFCECDCATFPHCCSCAVCLLTPSLKAASSTTPFRAKCGNSFIFFISAKWKLQV